MSKKKIFHSTPFYFIRHGETHWNHERRVMGQQDIPLNQKGLEQAKQAAEILKNNTPNSKGHFTQILSSPLIRALKTAEIISEQVQKPLMIIEDLKECSLGIREGDLKGEWLEEWKQGGMIEGAELFDDFITRAQDAFKEALSYPGPVLIVAHNAIYWGIQDALNLPKRDIKNAVPLYHSPPEHSSSSWRISPLTKES